MRFPGKETMRGIYLLPNMLTISALFAGFYAIVASMQGEFSRAALAILVAMLMDSLDGRVARLTNATSAFGAQLDSLADMASSGIAPALVLYSWSLHSLGKPGWLIAFIYAACTALRLARFNTQLGQLNKKYFQGLPAPAAAGVVASLVWASNDFNIAGEMIALPVAFMALALAALKVSKVRFHSFKDIDFRGKVPFITILFIVLVLVLVSFDPPDVFLVIFGGYAASGPLLTLWGVHKRRQQKKRRHLRIAKSE